MNPTIDISGVRLETESLVLRPFAQEDLHDLNEYCKVPGVGEMAGWAHHRSMEESKKILDMFIAGRKTFAVVERQSNKVIGSIGVEEYNEELAGDAYQDLKCREIGYVLSKACWGKGLMPQAVARVLQFCFEDLKLDAVFCGYFERNRQSARVNEKMGFQHIKKHVYTTRYGAKENAVYTVLHKRDWLK